MAWTVSARAGVPVDPDPRDEAAGGLASWPPTAKEVRAQVEKHRGHGARASGSSPTAKEAEGAKGRARKSAQDVVRDLCWQLENVDAPWLVEVLADEVEPLVALLRAQAGAL